MAKPNVINKETLLKSAKECLVTRGMQGFTLRAVAEMADVTQGTVYYHFRTKDQLLIDMANDACEKKVALTNELSDQDNMLEAWFDHVKEQYREDLFEFKLMIMLLVIGFDQPDIEKKLKEAISHRKKVFIDHLRDTWPEQPVDGVSIETWSIMLQSLVDGLLLNILQGKLTDVEQFFDELDVLLHQLITLTQEGKVKVKEKEVEQQPRRRFSMLNRNNLFY